jgi:hypothetical protein
MDKETLFMNVKIVKNKNFKLWTKDDIDNILIIYKYKDCYQYYDIVLSLLKKYIDWRKINNIPYNYTLINLVNVYLLITESLIINNYVNYYEIYDILHSKSICDMFFSLSSDTLLMIIVILFMIFRICYYIKILTKSSIIKSNIQNNNNDTFFGNKLLNLSDNFINVNKLNNNNIPNVDVFGLNLNLNEDEVLEENEEINNNNNNEFDIKNIFKDFNLSNFNFQDFDINDFNLQNFDISSIMKKFENNISKKQDNKKQNNSDNSYQLKKDIQKDNDTKNNNLKCQCHLCQCECHLCQCRLCNNCLNKKNI